MTSKSIFLVFLAVLIFDVVSVAQVDRAVLEGAVTDPAGAIIVGADVKVQAGDTGVAQEQRTNSSGYYRFPGLAVGRYTVTVANAGFKTRVIEEVTLLVGQTRTLNTRLEVGTIAERIDVKSVADPADRTSGRSVHCH